MRARDFIVDNMDHRKDDQAVPQLKAALLAQKTKLQSATDDQVYDIIDKIMTRIAKAHSISGQKLHDMWVKQYKQIPDTWIMKESHTLEERRKKNRKPRRAAYGPGLYGGYGYFSNYGNSDSTGDSGGGDGGGESIKNEDAVMGKIEDSGKIIRILKKAHTVPFSDEKNWLLVDMDPAKGNNGLGIKWIPADTRFTWVRPYRDTVEQGKAEEGYGNHPSQRVDPRTGKKYVPPRSPLEPRVAENFADGKNPQDKGDAKRHGVNTTASVSSLRKTAKQGGRKGQLAHWLANMKAGRAKKK